MKVAINSKQQTVKPKQRTRRKEDKNRYGTLRNIKDKIYFSIKYQEIWVKIFTGLDWNAENLKLARHQLDRIGMAVEDGTFRFKKTFPKHRKADFFSALERRLPGRNLEPDELTIFEFSSGWFDSIRSSGRRTERTVHGYKSLLDNYIIPIFGDYTFAQINPAVIEDYVVRAKQLKLRNKEASNKTINKTLIPFKMMCRDAAIKFGWGANYNPFFGFKKLPEKSSTYVINPFSLDEQKMIIDNLPPHWRPYFRFAFCSGLRQGEQFALRASGVNWDKGHVTISTAMTLDEQGRRIEGQTKNQYSQRQIQLSSAMQSALLDQKKISEELGSEYLFCTTNGNLLNHANLSNRVWTPALKKAGIAYRPMIQTRHSFATTALSLGENPLWIACTMGHRDTDMIIRVYTKYVSNAVNQLDGKALNEAHLKAMGNQE